MYWCRLQTYLQSTTVRLEEWRIRRTDTEQWMHHRQLPQELRQSVRKYDQYKWAATRGVDEEMLLKGLPLDLRRDIKRHLCYDLVRRVSQLTPYAYAGISVTFDHFITCRADNSFVSGRYRDLLRIFSIRTRK